MGLSLFCNVWNPSKSFDGPRVLRQEEEEAVKEEEEIENDVNENIEEVLRVSKREVVPCTTIEKLIAMVDQPQQLEMIYLSDPSNDTYPKQEDTQPVPNSTTMEKREYLVILLNKYKKECGWIIAIIKGLSLVWPPRKKQVKYKERFPMEV